MPVVKKRKIQGAIYLFLMILYFYGLPAEAKYGGGTGEPNDPYLIYTAEQMNEIGLHENDWDKHFKLMADIDLSAYSYDKALIAPDTNDATWEFDGTRFSGVFDGNSHKISNFNYTSTNGYFIGLFGYVYSLGQKQAVIKDLGLIDPNIDAGAGDRVGSLVGWLRDGIVINCYVEGGSVAGDKNVGGLVGAHGNYTLGYNLPIPPVPYYTISNCCSTSNVQGNRSVGGLVGSNCKGRTANCYATGSVSGKESVGGLVGQNGNWFWPSDSEAGTIYNCYSAAFVLGDTNTGGLVGLYVNGAVIGCFWDMETSGQKTSAGGVGKATADMKKADTFIGWGGCSSGGIWTIDEGNEYPRLWWEDEPGTTLEGQLSDFLQGAGTEDDPYVIYTARELGMVGRFPCEWDKHFKLMADIDLGAYPRMEFHIIGAGSDNVDYRTTDNAFTGVFDGNGHIISNFSYSSADTDGIGLFGCVSGEIKDLALIDPNVDAGTGNYVGSLVGYLRDGNITDCHVDGGTVKGDFIVGGLAGSNNYGLIAACYATGSVSGFSDVGGLVGKNSFYKDWPDPGWASRGSGRIRDCYSDCSVTGVEYVGGLVGNNEVGGTISNCYSVYQVEGDSNIGGLVGSNRGNVISAFWDIQTSGVAISDGGTGKTTAEMQTASTFLAAGWDFVDETANGNEDIWWILEGRSYPRLWWQYGLAFSPYPQDGAVDVPQPLTLRWLPGGSSLYHDVYFGEDEDSVRNATTDSPEYKGSRDLGSESYDLGKLAFDTTYYWRIDEVNDADPNSPWKGDVWFFTTANFIVVDDFEDYNDYYNPIWDIWEFPIYPHPSPDPYYAVYGSGWVVGDEGIGSHTEETIVHGGSQSMRFVYDNNRKGFFKYSEVGRALPAYLRDWAANGISILSIWFRGDSDNSAETLYIALNGSAIVNHDNLNAALIDEWTEWNIDLQKFADQSVNLTNVNTITLGLGNKKNPLAGGSGTMYFDDIRLYRSPEP
jgi:hypothetical protein